MSFHFTPSSQKLFLSLSISITAIGESIVEQSTFVSTIECALFKCTTIQLKIVSLSSIQSTQAACVVPTNEVSEGCVQTGFSIDDENSCFNNPATLDAFDNINIGDKICGTLSADTRFDIDSFVFTTVGGRDLEVTLNVLDNSFDIQVDFDKVDDADRCTSTLTFDRRTSSGGSLVFQPEKVIIGAPNEPLDAGTYRITVAPVNGDSLDLPCSSGSSSGPLGYELLVTDVTPTTTTTTEVPFVFECPSGSVNEQEACVSCTLASTGLCMSSSITEANAGCSFSPTPQTPTYGDYTIGTTLCIKHL